MSNFTLFIKVLFARLRFVAVFIIAALLVGYWDNIKNHLDKWTRPERAPDSLATAAESDVEYYSVMHPWIVRSQPGNCPVCGMPLVKRKKGQTVKLPDDVLARVQLSPERLQLAGIDTTAVQRRALEREIKAVGVLDYDETKVAHLSARVAGRADELFIQYLGQRVNKGDPVYSLYSPDIYTAMREYLQARKRAQEQSGEDTSAVYNATMQKLVLWGVTHEQLQKLDEDFDKTAKIPTHLTIISPISGTVTSKEIHQGHYVQAGEDPYTVTDLSMLWLQTKIYEQDVPLVKDGERVDVHLDSYPNESFGGRITYTSFELNPETRTMDARVEVPNPGGKLKPGMFAEATVRVPVVAGNGDAKPQASTAPSGDAASVFYAAMEPYTRAYQTLAQGKMEGVWQAMQETAGKLNLKLPAQEPENLEAMRKVFSDFSALMIELGKRTGIPANKEIQIYHCPMRTDWLQTGGETMNPYMGPQMITCGGPVGALPKAEEHKRSTTQPSAGTVLAIPRESVIDTGARRIVYVQSLPGIYDMREVKLGPATGDFYPVMDGLKDGELVVTRGAFLVDAENRLNPAQR